MEAIHRWLLQVFRRLPVGARRQVVRTVAPTFTVGAICVVRRDDDRLLLVRLAYRDRWGIPGGLLQRGEEPEGAARREALEEVGVAVVPSGPPTVVVDPPARRVDIVFPCRIADGNDPDAVTPSSPEILEVRWFAADELPLLQHEAAGALLALAERDRQLRVNQPTPEPGSWASRGDAAS